MGDLSVMNFLELDAEEVEECVGVASAVVDNLAHAGVLQDLLRKDHHVRSPGHVLHVEDEALLGRRDLDKGDLAAPPEGHALAVKSDHSTLKVVASPLDSARFQSSSVARTTTPSNASIPPINVMPSRENAYSTTSPTFAISGLYMQRLTTVSTSPLRRLRSCSLA